MEIVSLRADCARCAALCCVALALDRSGLFAIDKEAGSPCPNLDGCGRCRIHADRAEAGFRGCVDYDCRGAGQRVVQEFFAGRSWLEDGDLLEPMMEAFLVARLAHARLELLEAAKALPLEPRQEDRRATLARGLIEAGISAPRVGALAGEARAWLRQLGNVLRGEDLPPIRPPRVEGRS